MIDPIVESWPDGHVVRDNPDVAALVRTVLAYPEDDCPRLVLADKLDDTGRDDARCWAALIRLQCWKQIESVNIAKTGASNGNWRGWDTGSPPGPARDQLTPREWRLAFRTAAPKAILSHVRPFGNKGAGPTGPGLYATVTVSRGFVSYAYCYSLPLYGDGIMSVAFCPPNAPLFRRLCGYPVTKVTMDPVGIWELGGPVPFLVVGTPDGHWGSWADTDGRPVNLFTPDTARRYHFLAQFIPSGGRPSTFRPNVQNMLPRCLTWFMDTETAMQSSGACHQTIDPLGADRGSRVPFWTFRKLGEARAAVDQAVARHVRSLAGLTAEALA